MTYRKKLIEVALPLEEINKQSAREKSIRHGHPSTLHLWWARRPLAAARAVIFAQMVDDPSSWPKLFPTEEEQEKERKGPVSAEMGQPFADELQPVCSRGFMRSGENASSRPFNPWLSAAPLLFRLVCLPPSKWMKTMARRLPYTLVIPT